MTPSRTPWAWTYLLLGLATLQALVFATPLAAQDPFVDVTARYLPSIRPGAKVEERVEGWSHLLLLSKPKLSQGDISALDAMSRGMAERFQLALTVDVRKSETTGKYYLRSLGAGFALKRNDDAVIVASEDSAGQSLGFIEKLVLTRQEANQKKVVQIARTLTMAVFDASTVVHHQDEHVDWWVRHAVLVNDQTGQVSHLMWFLAPQANASPAASQELTLPEQQVQLIPVGFRESREIHVDQRHFAIGIPTEKAFAMLQLPEGTPLEPSETLRTLLTAKRFEKDQVPNLETGLRKLATQ